MFQTLREVQAAERRAAAALVAGADGEGGEVAADAAEGPVLSFSVPRAHLVRCLMWHGRGSGLERSPRPAALTPACWAVLLVRAETGEADGGREGGDAMR